MRYQLSANPSPHWVNSDISVMPDTEPAYGYGSIFYIDANQGLPAAVDFQHGTAKWTASWMQPNAYNTPVLLQGVLYITDDSGNLYALNPVDGSNIWGSDHAVINSSASSLSKPYLSEAIVGGDGHQAVLYIMDTNNLYMVPVHTSGQTPTAQKVFTTTNSLTEHQPRYDKATGHLVMPHSSGLMAIAVPSESGGTWSQVWSKDLGGAPTPPVLNSGKIFVGTAQQTMAVVDIATGNHLSSADLQSTISKRILVVEDTAYVPADDGNIFLLDSTSAHQKQLPVKPGGNIATELHLHDDIIYFGSGDNNIYGLDRKNMGPVAATFRANNPVNYLVKATNGNVYFGTQSELYNVNFAEVIHAFEAQSKYMVDFHVDPSSANGTKQVPAFQSVVQVYDKDKNTLAAESVKIWAKQPCTVVIGTQSYDLGPEKAVGLQTDGSGQVAFSVTGNSNVVAGTPSGLSTPPVMMWAGFMEKQETILIFQDQEFHEKLSKVSGTDLQGYSRYNQNDPASAPSAQERLLPAGFQGSKGLKNANAVAQVINNSISLQKPKAADTLAAAPPSSKYLAFPSSMLGVSSWPGTPDTKRVPQPGAVPNWSFTFDGSNAGFTPHGTAEEAAMHAEVALAEFSIWGDIVDFVKDVIHGVEKIVKTVWQAAKDVVTAVIHTAEKAYKFVVTTIEDAAHVVLGILKTIAEDIEKVLEALSWLFKWKDFLATKDAMKAEIKNIFADTGTMITTIQQDVDGFFKGLEADAVKNFNGMIAKLGSGSVSDHGGSHQDSSKLWTQGGGANSSVQSKWLLNKASGHSVHAQHTVRTTAGVALSVHLNSAAGNLISDLEQFIVQVGKASVQVAEDLGQTVIDTAKALIGALTDPSTFLGKGLGTMLKDLEKLVVDLLKLADIIVVDFLQLIKDVIGLIESILTTEIHIPLVSDLYKLISGDALTILDLTCLILAIPVTIIYKAITGHNPSFPNRDALLAASCGEEMGADRLAADGVPLTAFAAETGGVDIWNMVFAINGAIIGLVDPTSILTKGGGGLFNVIMAILLTVRQASTYPGVKLAPGLLWLYHWITPILQLYAAKGPGSKQTVPVGTCLFGVGNAIWMGIYAILFQDKYLDGGYRVVQNELFALSQISKVVVLAEDEEVLAVLAVVDFFLDEGNGLMELKYLDGGPG